MFIKLLQNNKLLKIYFENQNSLSYIDRFYTKLCGLSKQVKILVSNHFEYLFLTCLYRGQSSKQEAHGPHRSPEKTVQINKYI